jgi:hypothetical protein
VSDVSVTESITRPARSGVETSTPESTTAIAGELSDAFVTPDHDLATPETYGHCCRLDNASTGAGESAVMASTSCRSASFSSCAPVTSAATPSIAASRRRSPTACPGVASRTVASAVAAALVDLP